MMFVSCTAAIETDVPCFVNSFTGHFENLQGRFKHQGNSPCSVSLFIAHSELCFLFQTDNSVLPVVLKHSFLWRPFVFLSVMPLCVYREPFAVPPLVCTVLISAWCSQVVRFNIHYFAEPYIIIIFNVSARVHALFRHAEC